MEYRKAHNHGRVNTRQSPATNNNMYLKQEKTAAPGDCWFSPQHLISKLITSAACGFTQTRNFVTQAGRQCTSLMRLNSHGEMSSPEEELAGFPVIGPSTHCQPKQSFQEPKMSNTRPPMWFDWSGGRTAPLPVPCQAPSPMQLNRAMPPSSAPFSNNGLLPDPVVPQTLFNTSATMLPFNHVPNIAPQTLYIPPVQPVYSTTTGNYPNGIFQFQGSLHSDYQRRSHSPRRNFHPQPGSYKRHGKSHKSTTRPNPTPVHTRTASMDRNSYEREIPIERLAKNRNDNEIKKHSDAADNLAMLKDLSISGTTSKVDDSVHKDSRTSVVAQSESSKEESPVALECDSGFDSTSSLDKVDSSHSPKSKVVTSDRLPLSGEAESASTCIMHPTIAKTPSPSDLSHHVVKEMKQPVKNTKKMYDKCRETAVDDRFLALELCSSSPPSAKESCLSPSSKQEKRDTKVPVTSSAEAPFCKITVEFNDTCFGKLHLTPKVDGDSQQNSCRKKKARPSTKKRRRQNKQRGLEVNITPLTCKSKKQKTEPSKTQNGSKPGRGSERDSTMSFVIDFSESDISEAEVSVGSPDDNQKSHLAKLIFIQPKDLSDGEESSTFDSDFSDSFDNDDEDTVDGPCATWSAEFACPFIVDNTPIQCVSDVAQSVGDDSTTEQQEYLELDAEVSKMQEQVERANKVWRKEYGSVPSPSSHPHRKICFVPEENLSTVHIIPSDEQAAYHEARKGPWEEYARDRQRFANRIQAVEKDIGFCFAPEHRAKVQERLKESS